MEQSVAISPQENKRANKRNNACVLAGVWYYEVTEQHITPQENIMSIVQATIIDRTSSFEISTDCNDKVFIASTRQAVIEALVADLKANGLSGSIKVVKTHYWAVGKQEQAYLNYRVKGGTLPLDMYLNN
jgi:predicted hotdog family 3-hydroxylacyl-ACP dehydratase